MCDYGGELTNKIKVEEYCGYAQEYMSDCENVFQEKDKEPLVSSPSRSDILTSYPLLTNGPISISDEEFVLNNVTLPFNDRYEEPLSCYVSEDIVVEDPLNIDCPSNQTNLQLELESPNFTTSDSFLSSNVSNEWCRNTRECVETAGYDVSGNEINNTVMLIDQNEGTFYPRFDATRRIEDVTQSPNVDQVQLDLAPPPNTALTLPPKISTADPEYQETRRRLDDMLQRIISKVTSRSSGRRRRPTPAAGESNAPEEMGPKRRRKSLPKGPEPPSEVVTPVQDAIRDPVPIATQSLSRLPSDCSEAQVDNAVQSVKTSTSASALIATLVALLPSTSGVSSDFPSSSETPSTESSKHEELVAKKSATPSVASSIRDSCRRRQPMKQKLVKPRAPSNTAPLPDAQYKGNKTQSEQSCENVEASLLAGGFPEAAGASEVAEGEDNLRPDEEVFVLSENEVPVESPAPAQGRKSARPRPRSTRSPICTVCGRGFSTWCELKSHVRLHTALRCFFCSRCKQRFAHAQALAAHARRRHCVTLSGDGAHKPFGFMCTLCERTFSRYATLANHLQKQHKSRSIVAIASDLQNATRTLGAAKQTIPKMPPDSSSRRKNGHDTPSLLSSSRANSITDSSSGTQLGTCSPISANSFSNSSSILSEKPNTTLRLCDGQTTKQGDKAFSSTKSSTNSPSYLVKKSKTSTNSPLCIVNKSESPASLPCMQNTPGLQIQSTQSNILWPSGKGRSNSLSPRSDNQRKSLCLSGRLSTPSQAPSISMPNVPHLLHSEQKNSANVLDELSTSHLHEKSKLSKISLNSPSHLSDNRGETPCLSHRQNLPQHLHCMSSPNTALFSAKLNSNTPLYLSEKQNTNPHLSVKRNTSLPVSIESRSIQTPLLPCKSKTKTPSYLYNLLNMSSNVSGEPNAASALPSKNISNAVSNLSSNSVLKVITHLSSKSEANESSQLCTPKLEKGSPLSANCTPKVCYVSGSKNHSSTQRSNSLSGATLSLCVNNNEASKATFPHASSASVSCSSEVSVSKSYSKSSRKKPGGKHLDCKVSLSRYEPFIFQSKNFNLQRSSHKLCNISRKKQNKLPDSSPKYNPILPCPETSCSCGSSVCDGKVSKRRQKSLSFFCDDHSSLMSNFTRNSSSCTPMVVIPQILSPKVSSPSSVEPSMEELNDSSNAKKTAIDYSLPHCLNPVVVLEKIVVPCSDQLE